jgi:hypothetical protein
MRDEVHVTNVDMTWTTDRGEVVDFITQIHQVRYYRYRDLKTHAEAPKIRIHSLIVVIYGHFQS